MKKRDTLIVLAVFLTLLAAVFLLKRTGVIDTVLEPGKTDRAQKSEISLKIKDLVIEPEKPNTTSVVRVIPVVEKSTRARVSFHYRWFVNGEELFDLDQNILPKAFLKRNNRIYCKVKARMGIHESNEKKSKVFSVANSAPLLRRRLAKDFKVPGHFVHKIDAVDPDGDPLHYRLVAPLGKGIKVNPDTGEIRWYIAGLPQKAREVSISEGGDETATMSVPDLANSRVRIVVEVSDADGASKIASVYLDLARGKEIRY